MIERKLVVEDDLRTVFRIDGQGKFRYFVIISMKGTGLFPPFTDYQIGAFVIEWAIRKWQRFYGSRFPERKVGVFTQGSRWPQPRLRYKVRVPTQQEAERLADELCDEIESGIYRWQRRH